jgi:hypothetical protein
VDKNKTVIRTGTELRVLMSVKHTGDCCTDQPSVTGTSVDIVIVFSL